MPLFLGFMVGHINVEIMLAKLHEVSAAGVMCFASSNLTEFYGKRYCRIAVDEHFLKPAIILYLHN